MAQNSSADIASSKLCFVISPIGDPDTETRKKSDQVLKYLVKDVLEPAYVVERADKMGRPGIITVQVVQKILDADVVVADLTDRNPNVFYELAIRHAVHKPAIHVVSRGQQDVPFDVQDMRFIPYDLADLDSMEEARDNLRNAVKAVQQGELVITPVQVATALQALAAGENRDAQLLSLFENVMAGLSNLQGGIAEVVQDVRQRNAAAAWAAAGSSVFSRPAGTIAATSVGDSMRVNLFSPPASGFNFPKVADPVATGIAAAQAVTEIQAKAEALAEALKKRAKEKKDEK